MHPSPRVALVTGAGRGLGHSVARALAADGWGLALAAFRSLPGAEAEAAAITSRGGRAIALARDLRSPGAAEALVREVEASLGRVDAIVCAAGGFRRVPLLDESLEGWRDQFHSNLDPLLGLAQSARAGMTRRGWGRIVAFGLAGAERLPPATEITAHAIAKAGVVMLTRGLARALAPSGITVNCVCPGVIDSGGEAIDARIVARIPLGRAGTSEEVVAAVRFLLSDDARYVTGASLPVSGGWEL
ncbi:MAG: SDR family oxidoreductase [Deltaproteobacteria bacterium]|nr:SDR family oxidoreductase [Deltaproteobacteria bacterium]